MALKTVFSVVAIGVLAVSCSRPAPPPSSSAAEELEGLSVTKWTDKTELFAEYPPLVVGRTSRFAIHLTRLDGFTALTEGIVEVRLEGGPGLALQFGAEGPSRPGIFGVDVKPTQPGKRQLVITLRSRDLNDEHRVGEVEVYPTTEAAHSAAPAGGDEALGISFLKEQQWTLDFGTAVVSDQALRESIRVPAMIEPTPTGAADVVAPLDGRLVAVTGLPLGGTVTRGQELARLLPPPPGDLPQLHRAQAEAAAALTLAIRDRERAERLVAAGAAPARRLDEARSAEEMARTRLTAAEESFAQYQAARVGDTPGGDSLFVLRSPVAGIIAARTAANGTNVTAGTSLFRVVDVSAVQVVGRIPEAAANRARETRAAELEVPGENLRVPAGALVSVGKVLVPESRTVPITFALDNTAARLPVGQSVFLYLLMETTVPRPVVPAAAIVDDAGRPIVFVQREGETFERRAVTVGARAGDMVQITDGVKAGERVVTKGAYLIRLAALSTSVPAHGHVH